jgi:nitronate monooxygenase
MPVWSFPTEQATALVGRVRSATNRLFYVNYALAYEPSSLPAVLEAGAPIVQFSSGMPSREVLAEVRQAGAKMGVQVTSVESARTALDLGADYRLPRHGSGWSRASQFSAIGDIAQSFG